MAKNMRLSVDLDDDLHRRLRVHAAEKGRTVSAIVRDLILIEVTIWENIEAGVHPEQVEPRDRR